MPGGHTGGGGGGSCWSIWDVGNCGCMSGMSFCGCTGVPLTLHCTSAVMGTCVLTWIPASMHFTGTIVYAYPGNAFCPATSVNVNVTVDCNAGVWRLTIGWDHTNTGCSTCPTNAGTATTATYDAPPTLACSPLSVVWTRATSGAQGCLGTGTFLGNLLNGTPDTMTVTP